MGSPRRDRPGSLGRGDRKTLAQRFAAKSRPMIRAAEIEIDGIVSAGDLMTLVSSGGFLDAMPGSATRQAWQTVSKSKFVSLLRRVSEQRDLEAAEAFKFLLCELLKKWGVTPPPGTFTRSKAVPGAPEKPEKQQIRVFWEHTGTLARCDG
jgi:hypothetical protein